jgi:hypothetical protein
MKCLFYKGLNFNQLMETVRFFLELPAGRKTGQVLKIISNYEIHNSQFITHN